MTKRPPIRCPPLGWVVKGESILKTACIFVTWNSEPFLADSIGRLHRFMRPEDIVVVDNGSSDNTVATLRQDYPGITLHCLSVNTGFSGGNNVGIKAAVQKGYDAVVLLNVDTILDEDFIHPCLRVLEDHPDIGVVGPVVLEANQENVIQCEGGRILAIRASFPYRKRGRRFDRREKIVDVGYVLGAAMMIRREVIERIGYLDEDYFPAYVEEADFCYRARKAGFRSAVHLGSTIRHIGEQSSGGSRKANNRIATHRFYFAMKHSGPAAFLAASVAIVARAFYWKCRAVLFERS
jgi:GT2 family glycosyltransferase